MQPTSAEFLPFHLPLIEEADVRAVCDVLQSGWITTGPKTCEFENDFAQFVGAKHAIAVNSGTAALHVALDAIGLQEGDEVLVPTLTFAATAEAVLYFKARPVLIDCEPDTFNIDPDRLERAITPRTKAIIPVHFAGQPCEMVRILEIAREYGLKVIEDAAHALPARYRGKMIGTLSDITCFSFYATKSITTGEGGMATTENTDYADRMKMMRLHGISKDAWKRYSAEGSWRYEIIAPGFKYNLTDLQAALGLTQLAKCYSMWERRNLLAQRYTEALRGLDAFEVPSVRSDVQHAWHLYVIRVNPKSLSIHRDWVIEELRQRNIGVSVHFIPLHTHPYYRRVWGFRHGDFPVAEQYFDRCISLPLYPAMHDGDQLRVIEALSAIAFAYRRHGSWASGNPPALPGSETGGEKGHQAHNENQLIANSRCLPEEVADTVATLQAPHYYRIGKRILDFFAAALGLIVISPLFLACAFAIKISSRGPVFFRQDRIGQGGRIFSILKFRTMMNEQGKATRNITIRGDSRVTPLGRYLRKLKLDELPQLWNVLKGEMSLVGPRPEVPEYVATYTQEQRRVLALKPGITGPASLSYIDEESILASQSDYEGFYIDVLLPRKLQMDLAYCDNASLTSDLRIIFATLSHLFRSHASQETRSITSVRSISTDQAAD
jgi:perosamine synthetase